MDNSPINAPLAFYGQSKLFKGIWDHLDLERFNNLYDIIKDHGNQYALKSCSELLKFELYLKLLKNFDHEAADCFYEESYYYIQMLISHYNFTLFEQDAFEKYVSEYYKNEIIYESQTLTFKEYINRLVEEGKKLLDRLDIDELGEIFCTIQDLPIDDHSNSIPKSHYIFFDYYIDRLIKINESENSTDHNHHLYLSFFDDFMRVFEDRPYQKSALYTSSHSGGIFKLFVKCYWYFKLAQDTFNEILSKYFITDGYIYITAQGTALVTDLNLVPNRNSSSENVNSDYFLQNTEEAFKVKIIDLKKLVFEQLKSRLEDSKNSTIEFRKFVHPLINYFYSTDCADVFDYKSDYEFGHNNQEFDRETRDHEHNENIKNLDENDYEYSAYNQDLNQNKGSDGNNHQVASLLNDHNNNLPHLLVIIDYINKCIELVKANYSSWVNAKKLTKHSDHKLKEKLSCSAGNVIYDLYLCKDLKNSRLGFGLNDHSYLFAINFGVWDGDFNKPQQKMILSLYKNPGLAIDPTLLEEKLNVDFGVCAFSTARLIYDLVDIIKFLHSLEVKDQANIVE